MLIYKLYSQWQVRLFLTLVALPGFLLVAEVSRIAIADGLGGSSKIEDAGRAARLDPLNPEYQYRLGFLYQWRELNETEAINHYRRAVTLNPNKALYWSSLGRACSSAGWEECADQAYAKAAALAPAAPRFQWEAANYYLMAGREKASLSYLQHFLALRPDHASQNLALYLRAFGHPDLIWQALQATGNTELELAFIDLLNENGYSEIAGRSWDEIANNGSHFTFSDAQLYIEHLIAARRFDQASKLWLDMQKLGIVPSAGGTSGGIFNGGFEHTPLNAGFDWRTQPQEFLALGFSDTGCYEGSRCLLADFTVPNNTEYEPIYEIVHVVPGQQYLLTAYTKSLEITSDSGPRLRVVDLECETCQPEESEGTIGTTAWHKISVQFTAGPQTHAVRISLWRPPSRSFPMEIQGHLWLDAISLRALS